MRPTSWYAVFIVLFALIVALVWNTAAGLTSYYDDSTLVAQRNGLDLISGTGIIVTSVDDATNNRVQYTITESESSPGAFETANGVTLDVGTTTDVLTDLTTSLDGNVYHVDEVTGAPGISIQVDFTGVTSISRIDARFYYAGGSTHAIRIQLYNYDSAAWDTIHTIGTNIDYESHFKALPDDTNYISGGASIVRFRHAESGNGTHDIFIDYVSLIQ